ncbi:unnamed protein product [Prunus armeniaca]
MSLLYSNRTHLLLSLSTQPPPRSLNLSSLSLSLSVSQAQLKPVSHHCQQPLPTFDLEGLLLKWSLATLTHIMPLIPKHKPIHPKHNFQLKHKITQVRGLWWGIGYKEVGGGVSQIDEDEIDDEVAQIGDDVDVTFQLMQQLVQKRKDEQSVEISNEMDKYLTDPFESPLSKQFNLLNLWKGNQTRYHILSQVAKDIFAISSSTVASENVFSLGKRIVDPFRSSLHPKMVEALVCTSDWLRADEFSFYKEPTDDEVEFYKEMEHMTTYSIGTQTTQRGFFKSTHHQHLSLIWNWNA